MNLNENVSVVLNGNFGSREMVDMITGIAQNVLAGETIPTELEDMITMATVVRPSGSKYVVVSFA
jgi:hypothetical protein